MKKIAITGGIGVGKSAVALAFRKYGAEIFDSDKAVHHLYKTDKKLINEISLTFPGTVVNGQVDRHKLGKAVFNNPAKLADLGAMVHPKVVNYRRKFLQKMYRKRAKLVVMEIQLLFENKLEGEFDTVILVTAPKAVRYNRVKNRIGMTRERFLAILNNQKFPERIKARKADFVFKNGLSRRESIKFVPKIAAE
jgi:dephospho-CoA kinase